MDDLPSRRSSSTSTGPLVGWNPQIGYPGLRAHLSHDGPGVKYSLCGARVVDDSRWIRVAPIDTNPPRRCSACWLAVDQHA